MVQNVNGPNGVQQIQPIGFGQQGNTYIVTKPYEQDSFNGKTLLKIGGIAAAIYFRKNITGVIKNMFPNLASLTKDTWSALIKPLKDFAIKNKANPIMQNIKKAKIGVKKFFNWFSYKGKDYIKSPAKTPTPKVTKPAQSISVKQAGQGNLTCNQIQNSKDLKITSNLNDTGAYSFVTPKSKPEKIDVTKLSVNPDIDPNLAI